MFVIFRSMSCANYHQLCPRINKKTGFVFYLIFHNECSRHDCDSAIPVQLYYNKLSLRKKYPIFVIRKKRIQILCWVEIFSTSPPQTVHTYASQYPVWSRSAHESASERASAPALARITMAELLQYRTVRVRWVLSHTTSIIASRDVSMITWLAITVT